MNHRLNHQATNGSVSSLSDASLVPIQWRKETHTLPQLLANEFRRSPESTFLMRSYCKRPLCQCALRNHKVLIIRPAADVRLVYGIWSKQKTILDLKTNSPVVEKHARLLLPIGYKGWFEILNENGQSIAHWTSLREVVRFRPRSFLLRKDIKSLVPKYTGNGKLDLSAAQSSIVKAGALLTFHEFNTYQVGGGKRGGRPKDLPLLKCSDTSGHVIYLSLDEKCSVSPVAGKENISGVHPLSAIVRKFHTPLSVRQLFHAPMPALSNTDRHLLRLSASYRGDLLFISALDNPDRFYVITASMLEDHTFGLGDSDHPQHRTLIERHANRVQQFLASCHPYESLRYLVRHLTNLTNEVERSGSDALKSSSSAAIIPEGSPRNGLSAEESSKLFVEVDEIYYYVRTGRFPSASRTTSHTTLNNRPHLNNNHHPTNHHHHSSPSSRRPPDTPKSMGSATQQKQEEQQLQRPTPAKRTQIPAQRSSSYDNLLCDSRQMGLDTPDAMVPLNNYDPVETRPNLYAGRVAAPRRRRQVRRFPDGDRRRYSADLASYKHQLTSYASEEQL